MPLGAILEGSVVQNADGTCTATFGYRNPNSYLVHISIGSGNRFSPEAEDRGQPEDFLPGRQRNVFSVTWSGGYNLVWLLDGDSATAGWCW
jgi:hypothetical protein